MKVCPCTRLVLRFYVDLIDGALVLVLIHEDSVCELPLRGEGEPVLRALLRENRMREPLP